MWRPRDAPERGLPMAPLAPAPPGPTRVPGATTFPHSGGLIIFVGNNFRVVRERGDFAAWHRRARSDRALPVF